MGIIKKDQFEEKGTLFLDEGKVKISAPTAHMPREEVKISEDELKLLGPVKEKANRIIAQAEAQSREIIEAAKAEIDKMKESGYKEGMKIGKKEGEEKVSSEFSDALKTLNQAVKERKKIIRDAESEILRLSLKVAEQIIRSEVSLHRDVVLNIVSEAIGRVSDREQIIIKANREDVDQLKKYKDRIGKIVDGVKNLSIIEDSAVEPGGCIIETNVGYVDARISTKLKAIEDAFSKAEGSNNHSL